MDNSEKPRLLLHGCCAPCTPHVAALLRAEFDVTVFFFNPNIHPPEERRHRAEEMRRLCGEVALSFVEGADDAAAWREVVRGLEDEPEGGRRCEACFRFRLERAAREAAERGMPWFTTTLTVSPLKRAAVVNAVGCAAAVVTGVQFFEADFKKKDGFKISCELGRQHGLYRQDYCGCEFSMRRDFRPAR
jgi:epoxyqueuosine reductase